MPIRSKPALQNAETEWNRPYHSPRKKPISGMVQKRSANSAAPHSSSSTVARRMNPVMRTIPPTCGAEMDSCIK